MKKNKLNYGGIEEDLSLKALAVFFTIGLAITLGILLVLITI